MPRWRAGARGSSARRPRFSLARCLNTRAGPHSPHRGVLCADRSRWSGKDLRAPIPCVAAASCVVLRAHPSRGSAKDSRPSLAPGVTVSRLMMFTCDDPAALFAPCANAGFSLFCPIRTRAGSTMATPLMQRWQHSIASPSRPQEGDREKRDVIHIRSDARVDRQ